MTSGGWRLLLLLPTMGIAAGCPQEPGPAPGAPVAIDAAPGEGFRGIVNSVLPTIVFIQTEAVPPAGLERMLPGVDRLPQEPIPFGMGSGVLFTDDGYILTNDHVVRDAERVLVVLHDRRHFEAQVIARDPSTEVAVIRIEGNGFPAARLGDSDQVEIGDWVLAMGSPLGLQFSVTAGIVSGIGRALGILDPGPGSPAEQAAPLEHFIQTDAALSPGNSGGPLINSAGEVIGINTAVAAPRGVPAGYGFAIPSNLARRVAEQLIRTGEVRRPFLGVVLRNVTPRVARQTGLPTVAGAQVVELQAGSPADQAGVQPEDVVVSLGGRAVQSVSDLQAALVELEPGATTGIRVIRNGRELELTAQLGIVRSGVVPGATPAGGRVAPMPPPR
jgi:serine protease Do